MSFELALLPGGGEPGRHVATVGEGGRLACSCGWVDEEGEVVGALPAREDDAGWLRLMAGWVSHLPLSELLEGGDGEAP